MGGASTALAYGSALSATHAYAGYGEEDALDGWRVAGGLPHGSFVQKPAGRNQLSIVLIHLGHRPIRKGGFAAFIMIDRCCDDDDVVLLFLLHPLFSSVYFVVIAMIGLPSLPPPIFLMIAIYFDPIAFN